MLSFIVPARSLRDVTTECLVSINSAVHALALQDRVEWILLDDQSEPAEGITDLFASFLQSTGRPGHVARFRQRQHYTGVFAYGLSRARGEAVFFISNDMYVTPAWLRTVLAVSAVDATYGIIRGTAEIVDSFPQHEVRPPFPERRVEDLLEFAEYMSRTRGLEVADDTVLSGDAVLIRRAVIEKIGVMDRRFFGYFGDPDYGLRARRAGFRLVCAKGAWLKHYGQGHVKAEVQQRQEKPSEADARRRALVLAAWEKFRQKWDPSLPAEFVNTDQINWDRLMKVPPPGGSDFVAPVPVTPGEVDVIAG
jgi:hypothetical protein